MKTKKQVQEITSHLERLRQRLYSRLEGYKTKSKLVKGKTRIANFGYHFRKK